MEDSKKETHEQKVQQLIGFSRNEKIGIGLLLLFIATSPIIFSQFSSIYSFESTGPIGDTIGGITAPFVNLLAAYLVYKSFTAQIRANAQQRQDHDEQMSHLNKEHRFNYINNLFSLIKEDCIANGVNNENRTYLRHINNHIYNFYREVYSEYTVLKNKRNLSSFEKRRLVQLEPNVEKSNKALNLRIAEPLRLIEGNALNILELINEIDKSDLEVGIRAFYKNQIQNLVYFLDFHLFYDDKFIEMIENTPMIAVSANMTRYVKLKGIIKKIKDNGYNLRMIGTT